MIPQDLRFPCNSYSDIPLVSDMSPKRDFSIAFPISVCWRRRFCRLCRLGTSLKKECPQYQCKRSAQHPFHRNFDELVRNTKVSDAKLRESVTHPLRRKY